MGLHVCNRKITEFQFPSNIYFSTARKYAYLAAAVMIVDMVFMETGINGTILQNKSCSVLFFPANRSHKLRVSSKLLFGPCNKEIFPLITFYSYCKLIKVNRSHTIILKSVNNRSKAAENI